MKGVPIKILGRATCSERRYSSSKLRKSTDVCMVGGGRGGFQTRQFFFNLKALFSVVSTNFPQLAYVKS